MSIIFWIVLGGLAGWIASLIMGTNQQQGIFLNIIVGIVGAFLGGMVMNLFGESGVTGFSLRSLLVAVLGSVILLGIVRVMQRPNQKA